MITAKDAVALADGFNKDRADQKTEFAISAIYHDIEEAASKGYYAVDIELSTVVNGIIGDRFGIQYRITQSLLKSGYTVESDVNTCKIKISWN